MYVIDVRRPRELNSENLYLTEHSSSPPKPQPYISPSDAGTGTTNGTAREAATTPHAAIAHWMASIVLTNSETWVNLSKRTVEKQKADKDIHDDTTDKEKPNEEERSQLPGLKTRIEMNQDTSFWLISN